MDFFKYCVQSRVITDKIGLIHVYLRKQKSNRHINRKHSFICFFENAAQLNDIFTNQKTKLHCHNTLRSLETILHFRNTFTNAETKLQVIISTGKGIYQLSKWKWIKLFCTSRPPYSRATGLASPTCLRPFCGVSTYQINRILRSNLRLVAHIVVWQLFKI